MPEVKQPYRIAAGRPEHRDTIVAFNQRLAAETESVALDLATLERGVAAALDDPTRLRYWVAEVDTERDGCVEVIGQAAVTGEWSDWRNGWIWWLQSVYVGADHRGRGVFRALFGQIAKEARSRPDVVGLRLYVEAENQRAQETYKALGMIHAGYHVYELIWGREPSS